MYRKSKLKAIMGLLLVTAMVFGILGVGSLKANAAGPDMNTEAYSETEEMTSTDETAPAEEEPAEEEAPAEEEPVEEEEPIGEEPVEEEPAEDTYIIRFVNELGAELESYSITVEKGSFFNGSDVIFPADYYGTHLPFDGTDIRARYSRDWELITIGSADCRGTEAFSKTSVYAADLTFELKFSYYSVKVRFYRQTPETVNSGIINDNTLARLLDSKEKKYFYRATDADGGFHNATLHIDATSELGENIKAALLSKDPVVEAIATLQRAEGTEEGYKDPEIETMIQNFGGELPDDAYALNGILTPEEIAELDYTIGKTDWYVFKHEPSDGWHVDGKFSITPKKDDPSPTPTQPIIIVVTPSPTPKITETVTPTPTPEITETVTPTPTPEITETVTPTPEETPTPTPEEEELIEPDVPEGEPEPEETEEIEDVEPEPVPAGDAELPKTGTVSAGLFFALGGICLMAGGVTAVAVKKSEEDEDEQ